MGKGRTYTELKVQTHPTFAIWGYAILYNVKGARMKFLKRVPKFSLWEGKAQWDEGEGRILLGDNRPPGGRYVANQMAVCCSLNFKILHMLPIISICTYIVDHMYTQLWLAQDLLDPKYCVSRGGSMDTCIFLHMLVKMLFVFIDLLCRKLPCKPAYKDTSVVQHFLNFEISFFKNNACKYCAGSGFRHICCKLYCSMT
jgi:hypothetical protein